jgi:HAD superfamily hydrolase (TIGR01509 family)
MGRAVVSASSNAAEMIDRAGFSDLIDVRIDGDAIRALRLRPKPAPDALLAACAQLEVEPKRTAAFETTTAGVAAARAAGLAYVVAVDRTGRDGLSASGADIVVSDVAELLSPELRR